MSVLQISLSIILGIVFVSVWMTNMVVVARYAVSRKKGSLVPLIGGTSGALATIIWPAPDVSCWWWVPCILDVSFYSVLALPFFLIARKKHR